MRHRDPEGRRTFNDDMASKNVADEDDDTDFTRVIVVAGSSPGRDFEVEASVAREKGSSPFRAYSFSSGCRMSTARSSSELEWRL